MDRVWYVAYGSNLSRERFRCYVVGGRPEGGARTYEGCREPDEPADDVAVQIPGALYFGGRSRVWGGGIATWEPHARGSVAARAYLLTVRQFADVLAQESWRPRGDAIDLRALRSSGRLRVGPGRYETLVGVGRRRGIPMVSFAGEHGRARDVAAPAGAYLRMMATGLHESRGWSAATAGRYLAAITGAAPRWTSAAIAGLATAPGPPVIRDR
ncbi:histone deacetylase [Agromyces sp. SYSU T0242]|uniref:histone deacetylase n=1 Tax=Agromyces litoreus TaxID=3158561 RepID=UPI00339B1205